MYGGFIYFILVLLIYSTYLPPQETYFHSTESILLFFVLLWVFAATTKAAFARLSKKITLQGSHGLHGHFDRTFNRQAIMAVVLFAVDIYVLNLKLLVLDIPLLSASPTLTAVLFVALFIGHLAMIWANAHGPYQRLFGSRISRWSYVRSNIAFHFPVILPWLVISGVTDIIYLLPFEMPKRLLARPEGQVIFFSCFLGLLVLVAPSLIRFFWQCRPLEPGLKRSQVESLCRKTAMGYRDILKWPIFEGRLLTAGVMGLIKRFRYILVTDSLLQILNEEEIDAVVAHEIGHIKKKHLLFYLVFFIGFVVLSYSVYDLIFYGILYGNLAFPIAKGFKVGLSAWMAILSTVAMAFVVLIYFRFVFGFFMRNCERQADVFAFELLGNSRGLISSLEKIAVYSGHSHDRPSWHHFSIRQRIDFLKMCEADRRWISRHDKKLRRSMAVFVVGLLGLGGLGYSINVGEMGKTLSTHFLQQVLVAEIENNPTNPSLHYMLGTIHYQNGAFEKAIADYQKTIILAPDNSEALNNLAWIYATCEVRELRSPVQALAYAKMAAALKPEPHVLDTLAESLYVNGFYDKAVAAIKEALVQGPEDRAYYEGQLRKFMEAAGGR